MSRPIAIAIAALAIACRAAVPQGPEPVSPDVVAAMDRAQRLLEDGRPSEAVADVKAAVESAPGDARSHRLLGLLMEARDDAAGALAAYGRSLALREDAAVRRRAAQVAASLSRHDEAVEHWETVCAAEPADVAARLSLAVAYERADRPASAEGAYAQAVNLAPENPAIRRRFGAFLDEQGRPSRARAQRAACEAPEPAVAPAKKPMRALPASAR
jgi:Tfp pilus assembly protein PilF